MDLTRVVEGLGGPQNVKDVLACLTRIRVEVYDARLVRDDLLHTAGVLGVVRAGSVVQIVVGLNASRYAHELQSEVQIGV